MTYDLTILRAMVRLSRKGKEADLESLNIRCGGEGAHVRAALRRLEALGLVVRSSQEQARLTIAGLTVGVAAARSPRSAHRRARAEANVAPGVAPARRAAA